MPANFKCHIGWHCYHSTGQHKTTKKTIPHGEFEAETHSSYKNENKCCRCGKTVWVNPPSLNMGGT